MKSRSVVVVIGLMVVIAAGIAWLGTYMPAYHVPALHIANVMMAALSVLATVLVSRPTAGRPQAQVRGVYGASLLRLMACMVAVLVYVLLYRSHIHKPTVFLFFGIYAAYTAVETIILSKAVRAK